MKDDGFGGEAAGGEDPGKDNRLVVLRSVALPPRPGEALELLEPFLFFEKGRWAKRTEESGAVSIFGKMTAPPFWGVGERFALAIPFLKEVKSYGQLTPSEFSSLSEAFPHFLPDLVSHLPEYLLFFFLPSPDSGRIGKPHVQPACSPEKNRAALVRLIAQGDDIIETISGEFIHALRAMVGNINPDFPHRLYS